jgi:hypothetical protein
LVEIDNAQSSEHGFDLIFMTTGIVAQDKIEPASGGHILQLD